MIELGTSTPWGTVEMITVTDGERYCHMLASDGSATSLPWELVEPRAGERELTPEEWLEELGECTPSSQRATS